VSGPSAADGIAAPLAGEPPPLAGVAPVRDTTRPSGRRLRPVAGVARGAIVAAVYVLLALLAYWPVAPLATTSVVNCGCYDVAEQVWFLAWTPHAILHDLNPFFTSALNVPFGANLAANTSMPLLGLLASPLTLTLGPLSAYNALARLALCSSALSMCLVLRHYRARWPVAFLGGLLYGYSPYVLAQASMHLDLSFVPLLPLLVVAADDLFVRGAKSPRRAGLTLGVLAAAQYLVSSELLADFGILALAGVAVLVLRFPRRSMARLGRVSSGLLWAILPFALLAGYPVVFGFLGPQHVAGTGLSPAIVDLYSNDLLSPIVPTTGERLAWGLGAVGTHLMPSPGGRPAPENGGYLGIPLVVCWLASVAWAGARRNWRALFFALMLALALLLSFGPALRVDGHTVLSWMPLRLFTALPAYSISVPARFSVFVVLSLVICVAPALDALCERLASQPRRRTALGTLALVPLVPAGAEHSARIELPGYLSSPAVRSIAPGARVLAYPFPEVAENQAMLWQVAAGFRFDLIGGYVLTPSRPRGRFVAGGGGYEPPTLEPATVPETLFEDAYVGDAVPSTIPVAPWSADELRTYLRRFGVDDIVLGFLGADWAYVAYFLERELGASPAHEPGVDVWYDVERSPLLVRAG
jgi:hypothetical protein